MTLQVGDVIEFDIKIDMDIPEEDLESGNPIDLCGYSREINVSYTINDDETSGSYTINADAGYIYPEDDIKNFIEEEMERQYKEVSDYEIFDVCEDYDHQYAKVRVKSLKN